MKLTSQQVAPFLQKPGRVRVVLLYGDDVGMMRSRAEMLVRAVAGSLDDPFRVAEVASDELDQIPAEASSMSLIGGRRVVRLREASDAALNAVQAVLSSRAEALVVMEGAGMPARSKLRSLLEAAPDSVAIGCYPEDGRALEETIRHTLQAAGVGVDPDALLWLAAQLGADQAATHAELEKLALHTGQGGRVDLDTAMHCVGDAASLSLEDALFAATVGDLATTDRALEKAMAEGAAAVSVLRGALMHLQRLYRARLQMDSGMSAGEAVKTARPAVFFRRVGAFTRALDLWSSAALEAAMAGLSQAERNCKRTGVPDHTLARHGVMTLARRAMAR